MRTTSCGVVLAVAIALPVVAAAWTDDMPVGSSGTTFLGSTDDDQLGFAFAARCDLNGDGFGDLLISAPLVDGSGADRGAVYVYFDASSFLGATHTAGGADLVIHGASDGDRAGYSLSCQGDLDGDGYDDVVIGGPSASCGGTDVGAAHIVFGRAAGWGLSIDLSAADIVLCGHDSFDQAGYGLATVGDLDADGYDELVVGAPWAYLGSGQNGGAYLVYGTDRSSYLDTDLGDADAIFAGPTGSNAVGGAIAGVGDLDADGYGDPGDASCQGGPEADCDDQDDSVHPGTTETCNGIDDDCDGSVPADEDDADGDGYRVCDDDCDDTHADVHPNASEACDGLDNDCDGAVPAWDEDEDGDGHLSCAGDCNDDDASLTPDDLDGDGASTCDGDCDDGDQALNLLDEDSDGSTTCDGDCDDADSSVHPDAEEVCDGVDGDCDGVLPDDEADLDEDGFLACLDDCDDQDADIHPGAADPCDGVDSDCDGVAEITDSDGDGHASEECGGEDCDDEAPDIHPLADESCSDLVDNDCDGLVDDQDEECEQADDDDTTPDDEVGDDDTDEEVAGCECSATGFAGHRSGITSLLVGFAALWWRKRGR